jgi:hypothetical protein
VLLCAVGSCQERVLGGGELGAVSAPKGGTVRSHAVHELETQDCSWSKRVDGAA